MRFRLILLILIGACALRAGIQRGTVKAGDVPIPGATVVAVQGDRKETTSTDESGNYAFPSLAAGKWTIEVEIFGFAKQRKEIEVSAGNAPVDFDLKVSFPEPQAAAQATANSASPSPVAATLKSPSGQAGRAEAPKATAAKEAADAAPAAEAQRETAQPVAGAAATIPAPARPAGKGASLQPSSPAGQKAPARAAAARKDGAKPTAKPAAAKNGAKNGFQQVDVKQTAENIAAADSAPQRETSLAENLEQSTNEAFLVTGSVSRGLQMSSQEIALERDFEAKVKTEAADTRGMPGVPGMPGMPGAAGPGAADSAASGAGKPGKAGKPAKAGGLSPAGAATAGLKGKAGKAAGGGKDAQQVRQAAKWQAGKGVTLVGNRAGRGRDGYRGNVTFALDNSALDARPYSLTGRPVAKPTYARARFGINVGGPLRIPHLLESKRTNIFFNYQGNRNRNGANFVSTLPGPLQRAGDFSQGYSRGAISIFDPLTGLAFPGSAIPVGRIDPTAAALLRFIPLPNLPGNVQNYQRAISTPNNNNNLSIRVARPISRKDRVSFNYSRQGRDSMPQQLYGFIDPSTGRGYSFNATETHNVSKFLISTFAWNLSVNRNYTIPYFANGENVAAQLGITGVSNSPLNYGPPNLSFTNFGGLSDANPQSSSNQTSEVTESLVWTHKKQTWAFGGGYRRLQFNNRSDSNGRGSFGFTGIQTSAFNSNGQPISKTGFDFADFLLGLPQSSSIRFGGSSDTYIRGQVSNLHVQNDWRMFPNFTVNTGLRWELEPALTEKYNRLANLDIAPDFTAAQVVTPGTVGPYSGEIPAGLIRTAYNLFAPRLGLAWRPFQKRSMRVRAGYGIYFNTSVYNQLTNTLAQQPPFAKTTATNTSTAHQLTIQNGFINPSPKEITNTRAVDVNYRPGYAQTWTFSIQQDLTKTLVVEVDYLGTKGTHLDLQRLPNRAAPGSPLTAEQRRQIGNATGFIYESSEANSILHSAHLRITRRLVKGIGTNVLYGYGKSIDNAAFLGSGVVQNDRDFRAERGLSAFDRRHTLTASWVLTSPVGDSSALFVAQGTRGYLLRDWTLSGGITASSGGHFTPMVSGNAADSSGTGAAGSSRADATGLPVYASKGFFNLAAFAVPAPGTFGNAGRNTITAPASLTVNASFGRTFLFKDTKRSIDFRVEAANALNTVTISRFGTTVNASNYGLPTGASPMRTMTANLRIRF